MQLINYLKWNEFFLIPISSSIVLDVALVLGITFSTNILSAEIFVESSRNNVFKRHRHIKYGTDITFQYPNIAKFSVDKHATT